MGEIARTIMPILQALMPGFLVMIIFYWLADAKKPGQFEQVVQALICTGVIRLAVEPIGFLAIWLGQWYSFGAWGPSAATGWSIGLAVALGLGLSFLSQHDIAYRFARKVGLTSRASVGEWRYAFLRFPDRGVVLNLKDGRRLMGYPLAWPAEPEGGHFLMEFPTWIDGDEVFPQTGVSFLLIPNDDVQWVEFLEPQGAST
ncbi:DUF6338 family protein [Pseudomonas alliivorans]|uniref:DUF6338 family protein n=1 Tax=Pseudomonas alliivorans TaxID=2810613 RepID=UPI001AE2EE9D|nr:DUF6338 family protein [Pseudomonas alliivorans]MBP0943080.1 hypothetical protein [Pseudomonas alliivorans]MEE4881176.1 DUF6338 family protein [Pseudomonas alliivorans]MEE4932480.1 DUF6338 family protein [Pseudomonas alliivorans]MEE4937943.1 DUF6338 family protein [Pseudomonas alliivorans]MEE4943124.1 DUF6338 family protein [Pseudomonas alliivorans]